MITTGTPSRWDVCGVGSNCHHWPSPRFSPSLSPHSYLVPLWDNSLRASASTSIMPGTTLGRRARRTSNLRHLGKFRLAPLNIIWSCYYVLWIFLIMQSRVLLCLSFFTCRWRAILEVNNDPHLRLKVVLLISCPVHQPYVAPPHAIHSCYSTEAAAPSPEYA